MMMLREKESMMTEAERLAAEAACTRLIHDYARLNDEGRWAEVAALYTEDGAMTRPTAPDAPVVGRDALLAAFLARPPRASRHLCTNIVVDVEGPDSATAYSLILLFTGTASADGALPVLDGPAPKIGDYRDRFVRTPEGWRFAERRGGLLFG